MQREGTQILGTFIDALSWQGAFDQIESWVIAKESRMVSICNVHSLVTAMLEPRFAQTLAQSDMATPDGAPVAWMLRRKGFAGQARINGPDLMERLCQRASAFGVPVYFYGGSEATLEKLVQSLSRKFPRLRVAGYRSPPFRAMSPEELAVDVAAINATGAGLVFIGLGCPKQELWMAEQRGKVRAVMVGVGAAFDYHAGTIRRAPLWMQHYGFEWLYRLCSEPRRLWRRYLITNSIFALYAVRELLVKR